MLTPANDSARVSSLDGTRNSCKDTMEISTLSTLSLMIDGSCGAYKAETRSSTEELRMSDLESRVSREVLGRAEAVRCRLDIRECKTERSRTRVRA